MKENTRFLTLFPSSTRCCCWVVENWAAAPRADGPSWLAGQLSWCTGRSDCVWTWWKNASSMSVGNLWEGETEQGCDLRSYILRNTYWLQLRAFRKTTIKPFSIYSLQSVYDLSAVCIQVGHVCIKKLWEAIWVNLQCFTGLAISKSGI